MKKDFCTMGPIAITHVAGVIQQMELQGWNIRFVAFAGMMGTAIQVPGRQPAFPSFAVIADKEHVEGQENPAPVINFGSIKIRDESDEAKTGDLVNRLENAIKAAMPADAPEDGKCAE